MPTWVSSVITNTANRNTVTTTVVSPMPTTAIRIGTSAEIGALTKMLTHIPSRRPTPFTRAITMPSGMPTTSASSMPRPNERSVMIAALPNFSVGPISIIASITALNGGTMVEIFRRPAISQSTNQTASESSVFIRASSYVLPEHAPDLVDGVEVAAVAPDLIRCLVAIYIWSNYFGNAPRARREQRDLVGQVRRLLDAVGDKNDRFLVVAQEVQQVLLELAPRLLVDRGERLVHQDDVGVDGERAREADALAHAAGELARVAVLEALQADFGDVLARDRLALRAWRTAQLQAEGHVAQHVGPGQQREVLEHERPFGPGTFNRSSLDQNFSPVARDEAGDDLEQRGLAAAAGAEEGGELAFRERQVDVPQRLDAVVVRLADVFDFDDRFSHAGTASVRASAADGAKGPRPRRSRRWRRTSSDSRPSSCGS